MEKHFYGWKKQPVDNKHMRHRRVSYQTFKIRLNKTNDRNNKIKNTKERNKPEN